MMRRFELRRHAAPTGVSGTGTVAEGVEFSDGRVALAWMGGWPTSIVWHERGMASVMHVHGHGDATEVVWVDAAGEYFTEARMQAGAARVAELQAQDDDGTHD